MLRMIAWVGSKAERAYLRQVNQLVFVRSREWDDGVPSVLLDPLSDLCQPLEMKHKKKGVRNKCDHEV